MDKKHALKKHKETKKIKKRAKISSAADINGTRFHPNFEAKYIADIQGWYKKLQLFAAKDAGWTNELFGKATITLESFDGDIVLDMKYLRGEYKMQFPLFVLYDIVIAAQALNTFNNGYMAPKNKMKIKK